VTMRLFLASFLAPDNQQAYEALVGDLRAEVPDTLRPVPDGTQHLTMVFLGDVVDRDVPSCLDVLRGSAGFDPIPFTLGKPRILFSRRSPRLICVDLESGAQEVCALQRQLHQELTARLGTTITPPRPPHVTLARFRKRTAGGAARRVSDSMRRRAEASSMREDRLTQVHLVKSELTPAGPVYESIGVSGCES
jgi:2'-5' RNA ligase